MANPQFPLYIPSKSRHEVRMTSDYLSYMRVPHTIVVEEQQYADYRAATKDNPFVTLLVLDKEYQRTYDTFDDLGDTKSKGPGPARNFIWDHSIAQGYKWHWVMDDNIRNFYRYHENRKIPVSDGSIFKVMEDFCLRYLNVYMAGPNYMMFIPARSPKVPLTMNTRIYSCNLIRNDIPFRWRGRYNEDTDLSLRILKAGFCTVQFNAFLQNKIQTQAIKGGNTEAFYAAEGTYPKSEMLVRMHPDVARLTHRFHRIHHHVDYRPYAKNKLIRVPGIEVNPEPNEYDMALRKIAESKQ